jgi:hypothetical protein
MKKEINKKKKENENKARSLATTFTFSSYRRRARTFQYWFDVMRRYTIGTDYRCDRRSGIRRRNVEREEGLHEPNGKEPRPAPPAAAKTPGLWVPRAAPETLFPRHILFPIRDQYIFFFLFRSACVLALRTCFTTNGPRFFSQQFK